MTTRPAFSLCVYCGSRPGSDSRHAAAARAVGAWIGAHGGQLVYGGGSGGLMGIVADAAQRAGAPVIGVIPRSLVEKEAARRDCTELHVVENMHQRKALMAERADAFLALAGGIGTFEEFFETWTWRQLGYHDKPIGLLNTAGYYDPLLGFLRQAVAGGFMGDWQMGLVDVDEAPGELLPRLVRRAALAAGDQAPPRAVI